MFTGIVESLGEVINRIQDGSMLHLEIKSNISSELKIDQSLAHNGACLTITKINNDHHFVTAVEETLKKTNLNDLRIGDFVNLERCMKADGRFDGHIVYGHIDTTGKCISIEGNNGSRVFTFEYPKEYAALIVEKGSITLNGTSLTIYEITRTTFKVAIIPYTFEHTTIKYVQVNSMVNLEFDILGKYVNRLQNIN